MKCGKQLREEDGELCGDCGRRRHGFVQGIALYDYGSIADYVFIEVVRRIIFYNAPWCGGNVGDYGAI